MLLQNLPIITRHGSDRYIPRSDGIMDNRNLYEGAFCPAEAEGYFRVDFECFDVP